MKALRREMRSRYRTYARCSRLQLARGGMFQKLDAIPPGGRDDEPTTTSVPVSPRAQCIRSRVQRVGAEVRHNALQFTQIHEERRGDEVDLGCGIGAVVELRLRIRAGSLRDQSSEQIWQAACWCREVQLFED